MLPVQRRIRRNGAEHVSLRGPEDFLEEDDVRIVLSQPGQQQCIPLVSIPRVHPDVQGQDAEAHRSHRCGHVATVDAVGEHNSARR